MPSATDTVIARLQADCTAAEATERAVRAFAWRRLSAVDRMVRIDEVAR